MNTTSVTLLDKLVRAPDPAARQDAWSRFARIYTPLLLAWALRHNLQDADAKDFVQDVLVHLFRKLPQYQRRENQTFRGWLFALVGHKFCDFRRQRRNRPLPGSDALAGVEGADAPDPVAEMDEREYRVRLVREALRVVRTDFNADTLAAFELVTVRGRSLAEVAAELGITTEAARSAQRRVLARIREELDDFLT